MWAPNRLDSLRDRCISVRWMPVPPRMRYEAVDTSPKVTGTGTSSVGAGCGNCAAGTTEALEAGDTGKPDAVLVPAACTAAAMAAEAASAATPASLVCHLTADAAGRAATRSVADAPALPSPDTDTATRGAATTVPRATAAATAPLSRCISHGWAVRPATTTLAVGPAL